MALLVPDNVWQQIGKADRLLTRAEAANSLMAATRRELAMLNAELIGAQTCFGGDSSLGTPSLRARRLFRDVIEDTTQACMVIDPRPGLHIVDLSDAFAAATMTRRRKVAGEKLFEAYPDNPADPEADGVGNLYESIQRVVRTGREHVMGVQRYDIQDAEGRFFEMHWQPVNIPLFDDTGRLVFVLHHTRDLTPREGQDPTQAGIAALPPGTPVRA